jgi:putative hydrolase of the HAD superfamily
MRREPRAVLFDLDDTLYPFAQFLMSGFRAVAARVHQVWGHDPAAALDVLTAASASDRGREIDVLAARLSLPAGAAAPLIHHFQTHAPALHLSTGAASVLAALRASWRVGIVTNGRSDIQARKIAALGLPPLVDAIVLAADHGSGCGKPEPAPFLHACLALGVTPAHTVFVGDDLRCDIAGARAVGMKTIWLPAAPRPEPAPACADLVLSVLAEVPAAAGRLIEPRWSSHVA